LEWTPSAPITRSKVRANLAALLGGILAEHGDCYPDVRAAFAEASATTVQDKALDFGLARILDGLAVLITQRWRDVSARTDTKPAVAPASADTS
jgi:hypothetical protein